MVSHDLRRRFAREGQRGFTLPELVIVVALLGMMMAAIFGILQVTQKTATRASALEDAQLGARSALQRMEAEMRLIGSYYSRASNAGNAITANTSSSITFYADIDADTVTGAGAEATTTANSTAVAPQVNVSAITGLCGGEILHIAEGVTREIRPITSISGTSLTLGSNLSRTFASASTVRSVEQVTYTYASGASTLTRTQTHGSDCSASTDTILDNVASLTFEYFQNDGTTTATSAANIREIRITVETRASDGTRRTMKARVRPMSLGL
jgi:prepilin-type N-terminal cleavage/methylation domain-containing protein